MRKTFIALALGAMSLSACTSTEVIETNPNNAIGFTNVINKHSRAEAKPGDLDNTNFDTFIVYGYYIPKDSSSSVLIFDDTEVKKGLDEENKTIWTYDGGTRYWIPEAKYKFFAYSCGDIRLGGKGKGEPAMAMDDDNPTLKIANYICDDTHQHDLVCAATEQTGKNENNNAVALAFTHALCKATIEFSSPDFPEGYEIQVSNVKLTGFYNEADLYVDTKEWKDYKKINDNPTTTFNYFKDNKDTIGTGKKEDGTIDTITTSSVFLIPKLYSDTEVVTLHFTLSITKDGVDILKDRKMKGTWSPKWNSAYLYNYKVNINGNAAGIEPIVFSATQELGGNDEWSNMEEVKITFGLDTNN